MEKSQKVAILSVVLNVFLFILKYFGSVLSGSMGLRAEAFHSLTDVVASVTIFIGLKLSNRKTKKFPYGLYKLENLVSFFIAIIIFFAAYEIVRDSIKGHTIQIVNPWVAIISLLLAIISAFVFSRYELKTGRQINSPGLIADSRHISVDLIAMAIVVLGIVSSFFGINLDRYASIVVALFICYAGYEIMVDSLRVLLDASLDYDTLRHTEKVILAEPRVSEIKNLKGRNSGRFKFIEAEIVLKTHDFDKAHFIVSRIEKNIKEKIKNVDEVLIHYEPVKKDLFIYCFPVDKKIATFNDFKDNDISKHFGDAPYFLLLKVNVRERKLEDMQLLENPFQDLEKKKGIFVAEYLVKNGVDILVTGENLEKRGPFYVLTSAGIEIITVKKKNINELLEELDIRK